MRVALDAYPLFGRRTGIGTYVARLAEALLALPEPPQVVLPTASMRPPDAGALVPGAEPHHARVPFRFLQGMWDRAPLPPGEWVIGSDLDVFHATNFIAPPLRRTPIVTTVHDLSFELFADEVDERVRRYSRWVPDTIRRSRLVLCHAEAVAEELTRRYGLEDGRVVAVPLGVDPSWSAATAPSDALRAQLGLPPRYLVAVGNATARKRTDLLVAAVRRSRQEHEGVPPLVLVGAGPTTGAASTTGILGVGHVADEVLRSLVAGADALVFPSRYEGFGLPLLEAMAAGTPVVASDLAVHREVCGQHALLVELDGSDDERRLGSAIATVVESPPTAGALAAAQAWARQFTWQRTAAATLAVYEAAAT